MNWLKGAKMKTGNLNGPLGFKNWSLFKKFTLPIITVLIVGMMLALVLMVFETGRRIETETRNSFVGSISLLSDSVGQTLGDHISDIELSVSGNANIIKILEQSSGWNTYRKYEEYKNSVDLEPYANTASSKAFLDARKYLADLAGQMGYQEIRINDLEGVALMATNKLSNAGSKYDSWFLKVSRAYREEGRKHIIEPPVFDQAVGKYTFKIASPVVEPGNGKAIGYICVSFLVDKVFENAYRLSGEEQSHGSTKTYGWITQDGQIIASTERYTIGDNISKNPSFGKAHLDHLGASYNEKGELIDKAGKILEKPKSSLAYQLMLARALVVPEKEGGTKNPKDSFFGRDPSTGHAFAVSIAGANQGFNNYGSLFIRQDVSEYQRPVVVLQVILITTIIAIAALLSLAIVYVTKQVLRPIYTLTGAITEVYLGNYDISIPVTTGDELGEVSETFNKMISEIKELISSREERLGDRIGLEELQRAVSAVLSGDLTASPGKIEGQMAGLGKMLESMISQLRSSLSMIRSLLEKLRSSSSEIVLLANYLSNNDDASQENLSQISFMVGGLTSLSNRTDQTTNVIIEAIGNIKLLAGDGTKSAIESSDMVDGLVPKIGETVKHIQSLEHGLLEMVKRNELTKSLISEANAISVGAKIEQSRSNMGQNELASLSDSVRVLGESIARETAENTAVLNLLQRLLGELKDMATELATRVELMAPGLGKPRTCLSDISLIAEEIAKTIGMASIVSTQFKSAIEEISDSVFKSTGLLERESSYSQSVAQSSSEVKETVSRIFDVMWPMKLQ